MRRTPTASYLSLSNLPASPRSTNPSTPAYYAATKIRVTNCQLLKGGTGNGPKGREGSCKNGITVPTGHRVQIAGVRATENQFKNLRRDFVCDKDKRPTLEVKDHDKIVIQEVNAHQTF